MHKIVEELEEGGATEKWCEDVRRTLKDAKRYLKTENGMHCLEDGIPCPDHCLCFSINYALICFFSPIYTCISRIISYKLVIFLYGN